MDFQFKLWLEAEEGRQPWQWRNVPGGVATTVGKGIMGLASKIDPFIQNLTSMRQQYGLYGTGQQMAALALQKLGADKTPQEKQAILMKAMQQAKEEMAATQNAVKQKFPKVFFTLQEIGQLESESKLGDAIFAHYFNMKNKEIFQAQYKGQELAEINKKLLQSREALYANLERDILYLNQYLADPTFTKAQKDSERAKFMRKFQSAAKYLDPLMAGGAQVQMQGQPPIR